MAARAGWTPNLVPGAGSRGFGGWAPGVAGFRLATPGEVLGGAALVGTRVLYQWPAEGWVLGVVVRMSSAQGFSHVIRYGRGSALGPAVVASLLDAASHGPAGRWILLLSTAIR